MRAEANSGSVTTASGDRNAAEPQGRARRGLALPDTESGAMD